MSDPNDIYKAPEAELSNSKNTMLMNEKKVLKDFNALFENEDKYVGRRKLQANSFLFAALAGMGILFFLYTQKSEITWMSLVLAILCGLFLGIGLWFITFVNNWPIVRQYVDKEKLQKRYNQIDS